MAATPPFEQFLNRPRGLVIDGIERPAASGTGRDLRSQIKHTRRRGVKQGICGW